MLEKWRPRRALLESVEQLQDGLQLGMLGKGNQHDHFNWRHHLQLALVLRLVRVNQCPAQCFDRSKKSKKFRNILFSAPVSRLKPNKHSGPRVRPTLNSATLMSVVVVVAVSISYRACIYHQQKKSRSLTPSACFTVIFRLKSKTINGHRTTDRNVNEAVRLMVCIKWWKMGRQFWLCSQVEVVVSCRFKLNCLATWSDVKQWLTVVSHYSYKRTSYQHVLPISGYTLIKGSELVLSHRVSITATFAALTLVFVFYLFWMEHINVILFRINFNQKSPKLYSNNGAVCYDGVKKRVPVCASVIKYNYYNNFN